MTARRHARESRPARVVIIVQNLSVPLDRRVWLECQALTRAGFRVSVICPRAPGDARLEELAGVRIHRYKPAPPTNGVASFVYEFVYCWIRTALLLARILVRGGVDIVQACNPPDTFFALAAPLRLFGKRFVFDQHDLCPEVYMSRFATSSGIALRGLRLLERGTYRTADHVIATNESYRRVALTRGHKRPEDVTVVRNGPDLTKMNPREPRPEVRDGKPFLACYLGVMGPQDGVDLVLRAVDALVHQLGRTDCHFALIGGGDCFEELKALAAELEVEEWVTMTGRIPDDDLFAYLSTADVGLSPDPKNALNDVSTMNKTMEYMAFSLPVVAYDLVETRVSAEDAAVYADDGDVIGYAKQISELLDDPERRARMGAFGRQRIETVLAWQHQEAAYVNLYERLAHRSERGKVMSS